VKELGKEDNLFFDTTENYRRTIDTIDTASYSCRRPSKPKTRLKRVDCQFAMTTQNV
jgi:hypothetical protein